ncbi:MAG TPA: chromate transporter [Candidatus Limnocylindria bacterium]|nr:chromate transporter [Candidatus Limnocylindria bacterium]
MPVPELGWEFLKMGATAIGDTAPLLAFIERDLVASRRVLTHDDVTEALTYTKLLPGSTVVQIVAYLGHKLGGWPGSAIATLCYLVPSAALMVLLAIGYATVQAAIPAMRYAVNGVTAAVVAILVATAIRFAQKTIDLSRPVAVAIAVIAVVAALAGANVAFVMVGAGLLGIALRRTDLIGIGKSKADA